jgi:hypothetical protein
MKAVAIGTTILALLGAVAVLAWPASATDRARDNGEQVGQAVNHLYEADTAADVDAAVAELDAAVSDTRADVSGDVADQVDDQADALSRAADGFVGSRTSDDSFEADLYQSELDRALDDLTEGAGDFRGQGPEAQQAFWDGLRSEVNS